MSIINGAEYGSLRPIHLACIHDLPKVVDILLQFGADPNLTTTAGEYAFPPQFEGNTALMLSENVEISRMLLEYGADVNARTEYGISPLSSVCESERDVIEVIRLLLDNGADINNKDHDTDYPLLLAVKYQSLETIKLLADRGSMIDEPGGFDDTPVYRALECNRLDIADYLVSKGARIDGNMKNDWSFITNAFVDNFGEDAIKFLVNHGSKADLENERNILGDEFYNLSSGDDWKLEYLASMVDINEVLDFESKSPLMHFLVNGEHEMVEKMVKLGAKFEVRESYAHHLLRNVEEEAMEGDLSTVKLMMRHGFDATETLLNYAHKYDETPGLTVLILSDKPRQYLDLLVHSKNSRTYEISYKEGRTVISGLNCSLIISHLTKK